MIDQVVEVIRENPHEFARGSERVTLTAFVGKESVRIEIQRARILAGGTPIEDSSSLLLPGDVDALAAAVRSKMLEIAPASGLPRQFMIDIFLRGPRPHVEVTAKA